MRINTLKEYQLVIKQELKKLDNMSDNKIDKISKLMVYSFRHGILFNNKSLNVKDIAGVNFENKI